MVTENFRPDEPTSFNEIYDAFFSKITDDMYLELTPQDTQRDVKSILLQAIPGFEFPRFSLYGYDEFAEEYDCGLTKEEINIFALLMLNIWLQRQMTSIEHTRQKYTGADFKMTSQANHLAKLMELKKETERQTHHMQRLYKRRKLTNMCGSIESNWSVLKESALDGQIWY